MNVLNKVALLPQTDYELVLTTGAALCTELILEAVAWADVAESSDVDVELARSCRGKNPAQLTFLIQSNPLRAYASNPNSDLFISDKTFCGKRLEGEAKVYCRQVLSPELRAEHCSATGPDQTSHDLVFNPATNDASVSCRFNDQEIFREQYQDCVDLVIGVSRLER